MKKTLNEQISRIKSMMKSINESDFESQKEEPESNPEIDKLIKIAVEKFDFGELDPELDKLVSSRFRKYRDVIEVPVNIDENTYFTAIFYIQWNEDDENNKMGDCDEIFVEMHKQSDNLNDIAEEINNNTQPSMEVLSPLYDKMNEYSNESNQNDNGYEPDSMKSLGFRQSDFL